MNWQNRYRLKLLISIFFLLFIVIFKPYYAAATEVNAIISNNSEFIHYKHEFSNLLSSEMNFYECNEVKLDYPKPGHFIVTGSIESSEWKYSKEISDELLKKKNKAWFGYLKTFQVEEKKTTNVYQTKGFYKFGSSCFIAKIKPDENHKKSALVYVHGIKYKPGDLIFKQNITIPANEIAGRCETITKENFIVDSRHPERIFFSKVLMSNKRGYWPRIDLYFSTDSSDKSKTIQINNKLYFKNINILKKLGGSLEDLTLTAAKLNNDVISKMPLKDACYPLPEYADKILLKDKNNIFYFDEQNITHPLSIIDLAPSHKKFKIEISFPDGSLKNIQDDIPIKLIIDDNEYNMYKSGKKDSRIADDIMLPFDGSNFALKNDPYICIKDYQPYFIGKTKFYPSFLSDSKISINTHATFAPILPKTAIILDTSAYTGQFYVDYAIDSLKSLSDIIKEQNIIVGIGRKGSFQEIKYIDNFPNIRVPSIDSFYIINELYEARALAITPYNLCNSKPKVRLVLVTGGIFTKKVKEKFPDLQVISFYPVTKGWNEYNWHIAKDAKDINNALKKILGFRKEKFFIPNKAFYPNPYSLMAADNIEFFKGHDWYVYANKKKVEILNESRQFSRNAKYLEQFKVIERLNNFLKVTVKNGKVAGWIDMRDLILLDRPIKNEYGIMQKVFFKVKLKEAEKNREGINSLRFRDGPGEPINGNYNYLIKKDEINKFSNYFFYIYGVHCNDEKRKEDIINSKYIDVEKLKYADYFLIGQQVSFSSDDIKKSAKAKNGAIRGWIPRSSVVLWDNRQALEDIKSEHRDAHKFKYEKDLLRYFKLPSNKKNNFIKELVNKGEADIGDEPPKSEQDLKYFVLQPKQRGEMQYAYICYKVKEKIYKSQSYPSGFVNAYIPIKEKKRDITRPVLLLSAGEIGQIVSSIDALTQYHRSCNPEIKNKILKQAMITVVGELLQVNPYSITDEECKKWFNVAIPYDRSFLGTFDILEKMCDNPELWADFLKKLEKAKYFLNKLMSERPADRIYRDINTLSYFWIYPEEILPLYK
jgi:hypothetical protein